MSYCISPSLRLARLETGERFVKSLNGCPSVTIYRYVNNFSGHHEVEDLKGNVKYFNPNTLVFRV